jgi:uncharacterized protein
MRIVVFGATGRVGQNFVEQSVAAGHSVTAYVRDAQKLKAVGLRVYEGDVMDGPAVARVLRDGFDAVVVCLGEGSLRASRIMTDGVENVIAGMKLAGIDRLLMVSGTAEMPHQSGFGKLYTAMLRRTPVGHAIRDHDRAFGLIKASGLRWTLAGCNYLKDGPGRGTYQKSLAFPGGFKVIHPPDVADFLLAEALADQHVGEVVGIWY